VIDGAIKKMPEKFREVVILKIWSELTFAQIAEALDIPLNTAASRYRYGLEILKRDANLTSHE
jgi:RNA polymerase sigma-70 factor (ECF subfamily)